MVNVQRPVYNFKRALFDLISVFAGIVRARPHDIPTITRTRVTICSAHEALGASPDTENDFFKKKIKRQEEKEE